MNVPTAKKSKVEQRKAARELRAQNLNRSVKAGAAVGTHSELASTKQVTKKPAKRAKGKRQRGPKRDLLDTWLVLPGCIGTGKKRRSA